MATVEKYTREKTVLKTVSETVVEPMYSLELTEDEAHVIYALVSRTAGSVCGPRKHVDGIYESLTGALGYQSKFGKFLGEDTRIFFRTQPADWTAGS